MAALLPRPLLLTTTTAATTTLPEDLNLPL